MGEQSGHYDYFLTKRLRKDDKKTNKVHPILRKIRSGDDQPRSQERIEDSKKNREKKEGRENRKILCITAKTSTVLRFKMYWTLEKENQ